MFSAPSARPVSVDFSTADNTARDGADYLGDHGRIVFPVGTTNQSLSLSILGNAVKQSDRAFFINFMQPGNATLVTTQIVATIRDDDTMIVPAGFGAVAIATNLAMPSCMEFAPDGRLFFCEQEGRVRIIKDGVLLPTPFLEINTDSSDAAESGLLGLSFDPGFHTNHFVYVYYTTPHSSSGRHNRISRFIANGDVSAPESEQILLDLDRRPSTAVHNGGAIHFGPDGKLYAAVGENGTGSNSQTFTNLLGKMLRLNSDGSIPSDNPFFTTAVGDNPRHLGAGTAQSVFFRIPAWDGTNADQRRWRQHMGRNQ